MVLSLFSLASGALPPCLPPGDTPPFPPTATRRDHCCCTRASSDVENSFPLVQSSEFKQPVPCKRVCWHPIPIPRNCNSSIVFRSCLSSFFFVGELHVRLMRDRFLDFRAFGLSSSN